MYTHKFYPTVCCSTNLSFNSNCKFDIKNNDEFCLLWVLVAYLHPAKDHPNRIGNYNKPEYTKEITLSNS